MSKLKFMMKYGDSGHVLGAIDSIKELKYSDSDAISGANISKEDSAKFVSHPNPAVSRAVYLNKNSDKEKWVDSPNKDLAAQALQFHGNPDQVEHAINGNDQDKQAHALVNDNATKDHLKKVARKPIDSHDLNYSVAIAAIKHKHFPETTGTKPEVSIPNSLLRHLDNKQYSQLKKTSNFKPTSFGESNMMDVLSSKSSDHINDSIKRGLEDHWATRLHTGHHLILNRPDISTENLKGIGIAAGRTDNRSEYEGLAVTAMRHKNITKSSALDILEANKGSKFKGQLESIYNKIKE